jgi:1-deoxy-D-xylulose-5-phosphate synthase
MGLIAGPDNPPVLPPKCGRIVSKLITIEDGCVQGGFGSAILEFMADHGYNARVKRLGIPDLYIEHGTQPELWRECGYDEEGVRLAALDFIDVSVVR